LLKFLIKSPSSIFNRIPLFIISLGLFLGSVNNCDAGFVIANAVISSINITDPCAGLAIGTAITGGALCAGTYNGSHYMTTPGNCTDYTNNFTAFSPTCNGTNDTVQHAWANDSGTSAYNVVTGASSLTYGVPNTTILLNYTDTDAARYCHYMNYGGYTDWYLPAWNELNYVLYANQGALGGFQSAQTYWSSTENDATSAVGEFFGSVSDPLDLKQTTLYVRCVRRY
jgi:hypothetical protein